MYKRVSIGDIVFLLGALTEMVIMIAGMVVLALPVGVTAGRARPSGGTRNNVSSGVSLTLVRGLCA